MTLYVKHHKLVPDVSGAVYWPEQNVLVVADLHLEKGSYLAKRGAGLLPPYDSMATLRALAAVLRRLLPRTVLSLGDSFHDPAAAERLGSGEIETIRAMTGAHRWFWVEGNHDPAPPRGLGGEIAGVLEIDGLRFRHLPQSRPEPGEIAGHLHPKATIRRRGRRVTRRCFAGDGQRLILPAFGAYAGGLDVLDDAVRGLFGGAFHAWMIGREEVFPIASRKLILAG